ncbi:rhamnan synthesis F family protein [Methylobacterium sp. 17Sr1-1]|uniref:rhamnosyltransferase WsaF family glycosyltransferase n=1 Tax=Methylobacterium sp. 17Sr1-1 TaxID=2202826 RepID=UPI000D6FA05B|nr:rhamnan synthesis F family protein [Methylobacterium sp. 17Sr1-1]AWN51565.1 hypothetical protein DK412_07545 [Methylobacterium sp. 17Sr1-1]
MTVLHVQSGATMKHFDFQWYAQQNNLVMSNARISTHYEEVGRQRGLSPTPYFDARWYAGAHGLGLADALSPFEHFALLGAGALADPHPLFNAKWYCWTYMDGDSSIHPLFHYIETGWRQGNDPHPLFRGRWYAERYLKDIDHIDPFYHFLTEGHDRGCQPNPLFDTGWYCETHRLGRNDNSLVDYIYGGHAARDPHPLFDSRHYRNAVDCGGLSPLEHYLTKPSDISPCPMFDVDFFARHARRHRRYREVAHLPALVQYIELSRAGGIDPHPLFSTAFYVEQNPDLKESRDAPLTHYAKSGALEGRQPHPLFEPDYYREQYPESRDGNPLADYLAGFSESGARPRRASRVDTATRPLPPSRTVIDIAALGALGGRLPDEAAIGVFAHIFYSDLSEYVARYTNNIPGNCTIYISTTTLSDAKRINAVFAERSLHPFVIRVVPNRGRDIAPLVVAFRDVLRTCDVALHIHTKKSTHYDGGFDQWRDYLFEANLGTPSVVAAILSALARPEIGAVAPDHFAPIKPLIQWGGNFDTVSRLFRLCGERIGTEAVLDFPSGSMFWFKPKALARLLDLDLDYCHFDPEAGQVDGTLAHAIERSVFSFVEMAGYEWVVQRPAADGAPAEPQALSDEVDTGSSQEMRQNQSPGALPDRRAMGRCSRAFSDQVAAGCAKKMRQNQRPRELRDCNAIVKGSSRADRPIGNRFLPTDRDLGLTRKYYPECTGYLVRPSPVTRPRLNLLIPLIDQKKGYAGIATALEVFAALCEQLKDAFDARIVVTDVSIGHHYEPPPSFEIVSPLAQDVAGRNTIVDASRRYDYPVFFRETDILLATAWWTASGALDILRQQAELFSVRPEKFLYLVQDYECGFYPWSTKYALAERTYRQPDTVLPIFNTGLLQEFFEANHRLTGGYVLHPGINRNIDRHIVRDTQKEKIVLLYARPHAERNCLHFLDMTVRTVIDADPEFWRDWRFVAIGEDFDASELRCTDRIEIQGRLSLARYGDLASRAALAMSLMISPHPSYPPLELAHAGVRVLTNNYGNKDMARLHDNITAFESFDLDAVGRTLRDMAGAWTDDPAIGWRGEDRAGWFFGGHTNLGTMIPRLAEAVRGLGTRRDGE